jgi:hypothetical protein
MTGLEFVTYVKVKLNRLDSSAYEDVRPEEIFFYGEEALKKLTLQFDLGQFSQSVDKSTLLVYLASLTKIAPEVTLTNGAITLPSLLKIKDLEAYVEVTGSTEKGWTSTREFNNDRSSDRTDNPFVKSYADAPVYRLIDGKIKFDTSSVFTVTKIRYEYLQFPGAITEASNLTYPFMSELEDFTVTLILENLEARRLNSQASVSRT